jgi:hypothetical protein
MRIKEAIEISPANKQHSWGEEGMRIIDECSHFLGKMLLDGRVYVYCGRCKKLVLVHKH